MCAGCWWRRRRAIGSPRARPRIRGASSSAGGAGHRLGGAEAAAVHPVLAPVPCGQGEVPSHDRGGPRAGGIPLGHRLWGDGPASYDPGGELSDEPELSTPPTAPRARNTGGAVGKAWRAPPRRAPGHRCTVGSQSFRGRKCSVLESGRGRPVRRILEDYERSAPSRPTHANRPRPLRDEVTSGGSQPTDIRGTHRRESCRPRPDPSPLREATSRDGTAT